MEKVLLFLSGGRKELNNPLQLRALLLHLVLGEVTFAAGENVYLKTLSELEKQFTVQTNEPYGRHIFQQMAQQHDETVAQFVTKLCTQAQLSNFKDTEDQIRDQFLQGMVDSDLREKLLEIKNLTLAEALESHGKGRPPSLKPSPFACCSGDTLPAGF